MTTPIDRLNRVLQLCAVALFFGACAGEKAFAQLVDNMASLVLGAREAIVGDGLLPTSVFDSSLAELRHFRDRPDGAFWYAVSWAEGTKP